LIWAFPPTRLTERPTLTAGRRDVAHLGLDDRQGRHAAAAQLVIEFRRPLQQPGMEIEHISRIGLTARGSAQEQGNFTVSLCVLGQIVIKDNRMAAVEHEIFTESGTGVWRKILKRCGFRRGRRDDDRVLHRTVAVQRGNDLCHGGGLLADGDIDADISASLLVDDRIQDDRGFPRLAVADDELSLASSDRDHGINCLDSRLHRLGNRLPCNNTGRDSFQRIAFARGNGSLAVQRVPQGIHDSAHDFRTNRNVHDPPRPADLVALLDQMNFAHEHAAHLVLFKVEREPVDIVRQLQQLSGHDPVNAIDPGNAVADGDDRADLRHVDGCFLSFNLTADDFRNLSGFDLHNL